MAARFRLCCRVSASAFGICQNRYVIGVVGVGNCFCGLTSASFLCQLETVFFVFIDRCSKHVVETDDKESSWFKLKRFLFVYCIHWLG